MLYITFFCTILWSHRHRNLLQFLFKQSSASICTTVPKISNKSLLELFFFGTSRENFCPFSPNWPQKASNPQKHVSKPPRTKTNHPPRPDHDHRRIPNMPAVRLNQLSTSKLLANVLKVRFNSSSTIFFKNGKPNESTGFKNSITTTR